MASAPDPTGSLSSMLAGSAAVTGGAGTWDAADRYALPLYMPHMERSAGTLPPGVFGPPVPRDVSVSETTVSRAYQSFYGWSADERRKWGEFLVEHGVIDESKAGDYSTLKGAWFDAVDEAANYKAAGKDVTPQSAIRMMGQGSANRAAGSGAASTTRYTQVDLTDPVTARAMVNDVLAQTLGRAATDDEQRAFLGVLNAAERSNPSVSSVTATDGAQSSVSSGGLTGPGRAQLLREQAMRKPEYGAYQAAATYLPVLMSAISRPV